MSVKISVSILAATDLAVLVALPSGSEEWLPRSQIDGGDELEEGDWNKTIEISRWIAKQKGIEGDE